MDLKRQPPFWIILLLLLRYLFKRLQRGIMGVRPRQEVDIRGKTVVITGANAGLGKITATEMAKRGAKVVMACRNKHLGEKAAREIERLTGNNQIILMELDLVSFTSVRTFCAGVKERFPTIDILINNAGIFDPSTEISYTSTGLEKHFAVNHLGHFLLTNLLMPNFNGKSRIVTIGSTADFIEELQIADLSSKRRLSGKSGYGYLLGRIFGKAYASSKFANSLFSYELGQRFGSTGPRSYTVCPGMVGGTELFRHHNALDRFICSIILKVIGLSPEQGVETILYCALSKLCENETGLYYQFSETHPYENYRNSANRPLAKKLWEESETLVA